MGDTVSQVSLFVPSGRVGGAGRIVEREPDEGFPMIGAARRLADQEGFPAEPVGLLRVASVVGLLGREELLPREGIAGVRERLRLPRRYGLAVCLQQRDLQAGLLGVPLAPSLLRRAMRDAALLRGPVLLVGGSPVPHALSCAGRPAA